MVKLNINGVHRKVSTPISHSSYFLSHLLNSGAAEPGYVLPLQTAHIQISWLLKPTDLDLQFVIKHVNLYQNLDQVI